MIKKNGKCYVVVEFNSDFMAVGFEQALDALGGVVIDSVGTSIPARQNDDAFANQDGANVISNSVIGSVNESSIVIGRGEGIDRIAGRRVR